VLTPFLPNSVYLVLVDREVLIERVPLDTVHDLEMTEFHILWPYPELVEELAVVQALVRRLLRRLNIPLGRGPIARVPTVQPIVIVVSRHVAGRRGTCDEGAGRLRLAAKRLP
jgi:hypothetical protein